MGGSDCRIAKFCPNIKYDIASEQHCFDTKSTLLRDIFTIDVSYGMDVLAPLLCLLYGYSPSAMAQLMNTPQDRSLAPQYDVQRVYIICYRMPCAIQYSTVL